MSLAIINGSIQKNNNSQRTVELLSNASSSTAAVISLTPFSDLFTGDYIYRTNATPEQLAVIDSLTNASQLIFVVPTYFKSLPGGLKNFFDIVREKSLYEHKTIAFVASNHKNQDFGARQALQIVEGILEFFETQSVFVPEIGIINPDQPDPKVAVQVIKSLTTLAAAYNPIN